MFHVEHRVGESVRLDRAGQAPGRARQRVRWPEGGPRSSAVSAARPRAVNRGNHSRVVPRRPDSYRGSRESGMLWWLTGGGPGAAGPSSLTSRGRARPIAGRMEALGPRHPMRSVPTDVAWADEGASANHLRSRACSGQPVGAKPIPSADVPRGTTQGHGRSRLGATDQVGPAASRSQPRRSHASPGQPLARPGAGDGIVRGRVRRRPPSGGSFRTSGGGRAEGGIGSSHAASVYPELPDRRPRCSTWNVRRASSGLDPTPPARKHVPDDRESARCRDPGQGLSREVQLLPPGCRGDSSPRRPQR